MTKEEAIEAMQTHRVRHNSWYKEFWCSSCTNGLIYLADGTWETIEEFKEKFSEKKKLFDNGWEIIPNPERSVG